MLREALRLLKISLAVIPPLLRLFVTALSFLVYDISLRLRVRMEITRFKLSCRRYVKSHHLERLCRTYGEELRGAVKELAPLSLVSHLKGLRGTMAVSYEALPELIGSKD